MFIEVPGANLFALRSGPADATPIVAIGGWIGSSELWLEPLARLSDAYTTDGMVARGVPVDNDPFLQGLRTAYAASLERFVQLCIPEPDAEHIKAWGRKILARAEQSAAIALRIVGSTTDLTAELKQIVQPVLVLHGDVDKIVPIDAAKALAAAIPGAEFQVLEGCGHVPTLTRPARVADAIRAFLQRRGAG